MLLLSMEKSTQSRTAITPFSAFLMGDRPPLRMGGVQRPSFFVCRPFRGSLRRKASLRPERFRFSKVLPKPRSTCFQPSGELPRLPRRIFNPQKCSRSLARRVFNLREASRDFPDVFSTLKSAPKASLGAFSGFGRTPEAFVAVLRTAYRVFFENSRAIFVARRYLATKALSIRFKKNHHKSRSFYET